MCASMCNYGEQGLDSCTLQEEVVGLPSKFGKELELHLGILVLEEEAMSLAGECQRSTCSWQLSANLCERPQFWCVVLFFFFSLCWHFLPPKMKNQ